MTKNLVTSACIAALLFASSPPALAKIELDAPIPTGPQVTVGKLANGLTYYIQKNGKPEHRLELRLVVKAGSILEDDDQQGLAHFTEHMAFNGSAHFRKHQLIDYLQSIGVEFGADLNAYTSFDETVYILPIPTEKKGNIETGFLVLEDWAHGLTMNGGDIDKERAIVLEEARLGKGANDRMNKVLLPKIFNGSRYARRLPIGQEETLRTFKYEAIKRFYRDWYRPDLMAVVAVGDIEPADAEKLIRAHFGKLKNPAHPRPREYARIPVRAETEALVITDKEATNNAVLIRYPVQEVTPTADFAEYREKLVEALFAGMLGQRMQELAQQASPPFLGGGSSMGRLSARYKSFNSFAALGKDGAAPAIAALVQENERARQFGFGAAELERGKKNLMRTYERAYMEREKTDSASYVGEYLRNFLERESIPGIENEYNYVRELVPGITLDELNAYARKTIPSGSAKLVAYMGSSKEDSPTPSSAQLLAAVDAAEKTAVKAQAEKALAASLMEQPPKAGSIVAETQDKALGLTTLTLSNGVKVILKPTDFRNDQVILSASRYGGQSMFDEKDIVNARYANALVSTMGLNGMSPLDMQKVLAGKSASLRVGMGNFNEGVNGNAGSSDVETLLQMVYLHFTTVRRDEDLYKSFIAKQLEAARNSLSRPESVFSDTVIGTLFANNPRVARTPRPEDFAKISLDRSIDIYKARFSSARDMTFILVGSFDPAAVKPLAATYLASLPTPELPVGYRDLGVRPVTGVVKKEVRAGAEAKSSVSLTFTGTAPFSEEAQLRFHAMLEVMNIRINDILREKLGLIYSGGMGGALNRVPYENYSIGANLPTAPANVDKTLAAAFAEIERMKEQGPEAADLDKVKQNWIVGYRRSMRENGYWASRLQNAVLQGTDPALILAYEQQVAAITPDDLKQAARRYFDMNNYVQVVLYPEAQAAPK